MFFLLANTVFLILSIGYSWLAGSRLDRQATGWIVTALLGTFAAGELMAPDRVMSAILAIDIVLLVAITRIALRSPRYWPTWFAGFHLIAVACGLAALAVSPSSEPTLRAFAGFWGVPALLVMVFGLFLDRRAALKVRRI